MRISALQSPAIGTPITRRGVSLFPIYLIENPLPKISTGNESGLVIKELENAAVPALLAENSTDLPVLLLEGEHLLGGKQNRLVNASVLVPPRGKLEIPVSCLERGRWSEARDYRAHTANVSPNVRRRAREGVFESMRDQDSRRGNQHAVWQEVDTLLADARTSSRTDAAVDAEQRMASDKTLANVLEELIEGGPLPKQCGIAVTHGQYVFAIELFGASSLLKGHWSKLVRSHMYIETESRGFPSATRVLRVFRRLYETSQREVKAVGLGTEHWLKRKGWIGQALCLEGSLVHGSYFATVQ